TDLVVAGGTPDYLLITINTDLLNPSNITLETSSVTFALQFESVAIGSAIIDPLQRGYPKRAALANYIQGVDSETTIQRPLASSPYAGSRQPALSPIALTPVTIPATHQLLIPEATLEFTVNITQTGIVNATFMLDNPFDTSINILILSATATYQNLTLGSINNVDLSSHPIVAEAHQNITSPVVPFAFNLNPMGIIALILDTAAANDVDLGPLAALFNVALSEPNFVTSITSYVDAGPAVGNQFDVYSAILAALKGLKVSLAIESSLKLDEYPTNLGFNQTGVSVVTDQTNLVDGADLVFTVANITNLTDTGFSIALAGSLTNIVNWEGTDIANIALPPMCAAVNTGVPTYNPDGRLTILDLDAFTAFASYLLHVESFTWTIHTDNNFMLPSDDPVGGIHIDTDASIPSPSQLGIDLGTAAFLPYYDGVEVGPLSSTDLNLPAMSNTSTALQGRIIPQSGTDADTIGQLFTRILKQIPLLSMFRDKTLNISVILQGQSFQIIESIAINNFPAQTTSS
ncbi:hypothetical protein FIBSPDRAFT_951401, partial [Athelia psychrophila]